MIVLNIKHKAASVVALAALILVSCKSFESKGVMKDLNTGMTTSWTKTQPETVALVMNGEELGHTDIPLGESFELIAKNVKGLQAKDGKILVGCALSITDSSGKSLLQADDLFADGGSFEASKDQYLKCSINTGAPMKWEEQYHVVVKFWDKQGTGKIESEFNIRMIDIP